VRMPTEIRSIARYLGGCGGRRAIGASIMALPLAIAGCGEPSERELKNRRELEALLTAISLKNAKELDKDSKRIDDRHSSGELSDDSYRDLNEIVKKGSVRRLERGRKTGLRAPRVQAIFQIKRISLETTESTTIMCPGSIERPVVSLPSRRA
jgi:hypothetical protein